jgi:hypothetical protein
VAETFAEWVHPKTVGEFWVTRSDVPGNAFSVTKATKHAQRSGKANLACTSFVVEVVIGWSPYGSHFSRLQLHTINPAGVFMSCGHM